MNRADAPVDKGYLIPYPVESFTRPLVLSSRRTSIGSDADNDIILADKTVSRRHAAITYENGHYYIEDNDSQNGTYLNGRRIQKNILNPHDKIALGNRSLLFLNQSEPFSMDQALARVDADETIVLDDTDVDFSELLAQSALQATEELFQTHEADDLEEMAPANKARHHLAMLYRLSEKLRTAKDKDTLIKDGLSLILDAIPSAERCLLMMTPGRAGAAEITQVCCRQGDFEQDRASPISRTLLDWVLKEKIVLVSQDVSDDDRFQASESIRIEAGRSIICAPMVREENVIGVLYLDTTSVLNRLGPEDAAFAAACANELALCIENSRLQQKALANERMAAIGMTVTNLSHNIRNLIALNQNAIQLMGMHIGKLGDAKLRKNWEWIQQGFEGIYQLAVEMLAYAKAPKLQLERTDVNKMVQGWCLLIQDQLAADSIKLEWHLSDKVSTWVLDQGQCRQALLNLVVNAADAVRGRRNARIRISTDLTERKRLVIGVADNGRGIKKKDQAKILELFFTTKGTKGNGLGLPMVQKFMEQVGGKLVFNSKENIGSIFKMIFPEMASNQEPP